MNEGGVRGGGWCCPEDGWRGPCRHLRALVGERAAADRLARARELSATGLKGLGVLLEAGDPWAHGVLEELVGPDEAAPHAPGADVEGAAVLAGLAPAGFTRTSALPTGEADVADGDAAGAGAGAGAGADADADADAAGGDGDVGDPASVDGGPAWSRALRRRVEEVFDPGEDVTELGVGIAVLAGMRGGADLAAVLAGTRTTAVGRAVGVEVVAAHRRVQAWAAGRRGGWRWPRPGWPRPGPGTATRAWPSRWR